MSPTFIVFITPALIYLFFFLVNKFIDLEDYNTVSAFNEYRFKRFKKLFEISLLILSICICYLLGRFYQGKIIEHFQNLERGTQLLIYDNDLVVYLLPALFLGMVLSANSLFFLFWVYLREDFKSFYHYVNNYEGFDTSKLGRPLISFILIGNILFLWFASAHFFYIKEDKIFYSKLFRLKTVVYPFESLYRIEECTLVSKYGDSQSLILYLKDGEIINLNNFSNTQLEADLDFFKNFLLKKSKLNIIKVGRC